MVNSEGQINNMEKWNHDWLPALTKKDILEKLKNVPDVSSHLYSAIILLFCLTQWFGSKNLSVNL